MDSSCHYCTKRSLYCHDKCESYLKYLKIIKMRRSSRRIGSGIKSGIMLER